MDIAILNFGEFSLYRGQRRLELKGSPVSIGGRALDLLLLLTSRPGHVFSAAEIAKFVWSRAVVDDANLRAQIASLRRILSESHGDHKFIVNVPGRGYCFVPQRELSVVERIPNANDPFPPITARFTPIFGRDRVIGDILVQLPLTRLLTIVGPGGIGKSTVASAVLSLGQNAYRDGVTVIDLAPITNPQLLLTAIASSLNYVPRAGNLANEIISHLQGKHVLIFVDSCEHLIDPVAAWIEEIVSKTTGVHILATSREPIRIQGERVHRLSGLDVPEQADGDNPVDALRYASVRLFVERASACLGGYELSAQDAPKVSEICRRLDGIALAIELAAGRLETLGVHSLAASLDNCFRILTHGRRTALPRHQTLRATLDWSYNILAPSEQQALQAISIFSGCFTSEGFGATAMAGSSDEELEDCLSRLVSKSLVSAQPTAQLTLYRLLDTTRTYAGEKLSLAGGHQAAASRHAAYALSLFERAESELHALPAQGWTEDYRHHLPTLRSAMQWAFSPDGDAMMASRLTIAALPLFFKMSLLDECFDYVTRSIAHLEANPGLDERSRMKLYAALGWPQMLSTGNNGMSAWSEALQIAESINDIDHQLRAVWAGWVDRVNSAEPVAGLAFADRFRELAAHSSDKTDLVLAGRLQAATLHWLGRQDECRQGIEAMLNAYGEPPSSHATRFQFDQRVTARTILARTLWLQGFPDQALAEIQSTIHYAESIEHNLSLSNVLAEAACSVALWARDIDLARNYITRLKDCTKSHSLDVWHTYSKCFAGSLALLTNDPQQCVDLIADGLGHLEASGFLLFRTEFLAIEALAQIQLVNLVEATRLIDDAMAQCGRSGERWYLAELHRVKGLVHLADEPMDVRGAAESQFQEGLRIARGNQALAWELRLAIALARLWFRQSKAAEAASFLSSVYSRFSEGFESADLKEARRLLDSWTSEALVA